MDTENLKQQISDKELRLSQLRTMDGNKLTEEVKELIKATEREITDLKGKLGEEA